MCTSSLVFIRVIGCCLLKKKEESFAGTVNVTEKLVRENASASGSLAVFCLWSSGR